MCIFNLRPPRIKQLIWPVLLALAFQAHAGSGWTDDVLVSEVTPTDLHYYVVRLNVKENPSRCEEKSFFYQDYDRRGADQMFETLLKALADNLKVRVYVTGKCNIHGYSEISSVSARR